MNLPFLKNKKEEKEYFLALILSLGEIRGILFEKTPQGLIILGTKKEEFEGTLEELTPERLIEVSDVVISDVEKNLPEGTEFDKAIFVVPHAWIIDGKIEKNHLLKLKQLCEVLRLTPIGFIVSIEAIAAYLHKKEGVPVTAIFSEIGKKHITLSIVKNGSVLYIADEEIKDDPISSVEEILDSQDAIDVLPSKIILLNFDNAKKLEQSFVSHQWSKKLQFLHIPKVEVLSTEIESQAVISGVAAQMGFDSAIAAPETTAEEKKIIPEEEIATSEESSEKSVPEEKTIHFTGESLGFYKDKDVIKNRQEEQESYATAAVQVKIPEETSIASQNEPVINNSSSFIDKIPKFNVNLFSGFLNNFLSGKKSVLYPVIGVVVLIALIFGYYYIFEKVEVIMVLNKQEVKKDLTVEFSQDKKTSAGDSIIHIDIKSVSENGKEEKNTTGTKETGEKAKGEVTILSSLNKDTTIEKGTVLTSSNSLKFTLDSDVKIASSSGISDIKSAKGKITASDIGKEYNLPSSTKFSVAGFDKSSVEAKNESALSGGSKKEIKVVSAGDVDSLTTRLVDTLSNKAIEQAQSEKKEDEQVLSIPLDYKFDEKSFSKEAGDEADSLSLTATISYNLGYYNVKEIGDLAKEIAGDAVPQNYNYSGNDSKVTVEDVKKEEDKITGKVSFASVFLPNIETNNVPSKITGKSEQKAQEILSSEGVTDVQIVYLRTIPMFPKILPFNKNNIIVTSKTE